MKSLICRDSPRFAYLVCDLSSATSALKDQMTAIAPPLPRCRSTFDALVSHVAWKSLR